MSIDVVRTRPEGVSTDERPADDAGERRAEATGRPSPPVDGSRRRVVDVSALSARTVATYARDAVGTDRVGLGRRPGRTYLVVD
jgi:hypothetical protein